MWFFVHQDLLQRRTKLNLVCCLIKFTLSWRRTLGCRSFESSSHRFSAFPLSTRAERVFWIICHLCLSTICYYFCLLLLFCLRWYSAPIVAFQTRFPCKVIKFRNNIHTQYMLVLRDVAHYTIFKRCNGKIIFST